MAQRDRFYSPDQGIRDESALGVERVEPVVILRGDAAGELDRRDTEEQQLRADPEGDRRAVDGDKRRNFIGPRHRAVLAFLALYKKENASSLLFLSAFPYVCPEPVLVK
jgi:hypothetical protein